MSYHSKTYFKLKIYNKPNLCNNKKIKIFIFWIFRILKYGECVKMWEVTVLFFYKPGLKRKLFWLIKKNIVEQLLPLKVIINKH